MILVTGATGTVGGEVVKQLSSSAVPFRALVRSAEKARGKFPSGADIVQGDFGRPETLDFAMRGVDKVFLASPSVNEQVELEGNVINAAKRAGVRRLVKLSALGASPLAPITLHRWHWEIEKLAEESGVAFTHLRPHLFMQNTLEFAPTIAMEGEFCASTLTGKASFIDARDIAGVAVASLTRDGHENRAYDLTGPEALDYPTVAEKISAAIGKPVTYRRMPPETTGQTMVESGAPEWIVEDSLALAWLIEQGYGAAVTGNVSRVTGRPAITFDQFARDYASVFATGKA